MNLLFYHPDVSHLRGGNGDVGDADVINRVGISGTETAMLESAQVLAADHGVHVFLVGFVKQTRETAEGVRFVTSADLDGDIVPWKAIDWFCPIFFGWEHDPDIASMMDRLDPTRARVLFWMHCNVPDAVLRWYAARFPTYVQCLSHFSLKDLGHLLATGEMPVASDVVRKAWVVPYGLDPVFVCSQQQPRKPRGAWSFFAVHERGGAVAERVFRRVQQSCPEAATQLHYASYYLGDASRSLQETTVVNHGALSKKAIATLLQDIEYFVYPLVLPCGIVHHDTFAAVVLEAMAAGVIVVTWDVACLKEVHGGAGAVVFLDPPAHPSYDPRSKFGGRNSAMLEDAAVERLANAVLDIERDPDAKARRIADGIAWARTCTWSSAAARMYQHLESTTRTIRHGRV